MSHLPLWYMGNLPHELCDQVVRELTPDEFNDATLGVEGEERNESTRKTKVSFAPPDYWLGDSLKQFALHANNECGWDYETTGSERVQFAQYEVGHHYTWHTDTFTLSGKPVDRKITVVCLLNDEFEGGDFEVRLYGDYNAQLKKGSIIAFPSILEHRVTPVLKGTRNSATVWLNGPRFK